MNSTTESRELVETKTMGSLSLPKPQNEAATLCISIIDRIGAALPPGFASQQFAVACISEVNALSKPCTPKSVAMAAFNFAVLGLIPGPALGHGYFVPYDDRRNNQTLCQAIVGYRGFLDLAFANNFLRDVHADVVLAGEEFRYWKDSNGPQIHHEPPLERELDRKNVVAAYCIYHTANGGHGIKVVSRKELDKIDRSDSRGRNPWQTDYCAMAMKTPVRRAAKEWRITHRLGLAIQLDEQAERGMQEPLKDGFNIDGAQKPGMSFDDFDDETDDQREARLEREAIAAEQAAAREYEDANK